MRRWNFREACLLGISGELTPQARRRLFQYICENPAAKRQYDEIRESFNTLAMIPPGELGEADIREVPHSIKQAVHRMVRARQLEIKARRRRLLLRYALSSVASAAAAMAIVGILSLPAKSPANPAAKDQVVRINAAIDRLASNGDLASSPYDQAVTDVEASIRQLETESPTLAQVHDKNMYNLLDTLATMPLDRDDFAISDANLPPGSL